MHTLIHPSLTITSLLPSPHTTHLLDTPAHTSYNSPTSSLRYLKTPSATPLTPLIPLLLLSTPMLPMFSMFPVMMAPLIITRVFRILGVAIFIVFLSSAAIIAR